MLFVFSFFLGIALAQNATPEIDPNKYTVCAITINSSDEKKVFASQVEKYPKKFNPIIELTDFGEDDWFKKACESKIRCDQLVISGHFAGSFFGESGKTLDIKELEHAGCNNTCEGILSQPLEVFLFGCNTLATKEKDLRTPVQYLQVLLADGIPRRQAEIIVESRYGSYGDNNKATMQRAFSGAGKQLYGFDSIGPSGKNVSGFLKNYFNKTSAPTRLADLESKRLLKKANTLNKSLSDSLKATAFTQCHVSAQDEKSSNICALLSDKLTDSQKLDKVLEILTLSDSQAYFPALGQYFKGLDKTKLSEKDIVQFNTLANNQTIRNQFLGLMGSTKALEIKSEIVALASNMGLLTKKEIEEKIKPDVSKLLATPLSENGDVDRICEIAANLRGAVDWNNSDIPDRLFNPYDLSALNCLRITETSFHSKVVKNYSPTGNYYEDKLLLLFLKSLPSDEKLTSEAISVINIVMEKGTYQDSFEAMKISNSILKVNPGVEKGILRICESSSLEIMETCAQAIKLQPSITKELVFDFLTGLTYVGKPECLSCLDYLVSLPSQVPQNQSYALQILASYSIYSTKSKKKMVNYLSLNSISPGLYDMLIQSFQSSENTEIKAEIAGLIKKQKPLNAGLSKVLSESGF